MRSLVRQFHNQLRQVLLEISPYTNPKNEENWPDNWKQVSYKEYDRNQSIELPIDPSVALNDSSLFVALESRRSAQEFSQEPIDLDSLSALLRYSAGIRDRHKIKNWAITRRHYPSAGGLYPLEIYVAVQAKGISGMPNGVYHYNVKKHHCESVGDADLAARLFQHLEHRHAPVTILISAVWGRTLQKYSDWGYPLILLEAGHLAQNLILVSEALGLKTCPSVSFDDGGVDDILDFTKRDQENVIYAVALGQAG